MPLPAAIVPPAVTRDRNNPLTLAMQSALVPAQGMFAKESTQSRTTIKGVGQDIEVCLLCRGLCIVVVWVGVAECRLRAVACF
jgi:hypothetical protein